MYENVCERMSASVPPSSLGVLDFMSWRSVHALTHSFSGLSLGAFQGQEVHNAQAHHALRPVP